MKKEFVPYELASRMKQLGFDEPCFALYLDNDKKTITSSREGADTNSWLKEHYKAYGDSVTAPLFQQAFRWFREKQGYHIDLFVDDDKTFGFCITYFTYTARVDNPIQRGFNTYEEAELACLTKLIEIVENNLVD
jgi:hypothetical protein